MRITRLKAENVMRIRAIEIEPDGNMVVISGRNGQGKSSVLNAIWLAIQGAAASREVPDPVRHGEQEAFVEVTLGDLVVTRRWSSGRASRLEVKARGTQVDHSIAQEELPEAAPPAAATESLVGLARLLPDGGFPGQAIASLGIKTTGATLAPDSGRVKRKRAPGIRQESVKRPARCDRAFCRTASSSRISGGSWKAPVRQRGLTRRLHGLTSSQSCPVV